MPIGGKDAFLSKVTFRRESNWVSKTKQILKDMKSIKERANEYIGHPFEVDESSTITMARHSYIQGATEQRQIDIDKACEWFGNYLMDIGCPDDWMRDSKVQSSGEQRFRKAMEG